MIFRYTTRSPLNVSKFARDLIDELEDERESFTKAEVLSLVLQAAESIDEPLDADSFKLRNALAPVYRETCVSRWLPDGSNDLMPKNRMSVKQITGAAKQHRDWAERCFTAASKRCTKMGEIAVYVAQGMTYKAAEQLVEAEWAERGE